MFLNIVPVENLILIVELSVLLFLIWHIKELNETSRDMHELITELHRGHQETRQDTKNIQDIVGRLEQDLSEVRAACRKSPGRLRQRK